jgi:hypothetical protein
VQPRRAAGACLGDCHAGFGGSNSNCVGQALSQQQQQQQQFGMLIPVRCAIVSVVCWGRRGGCSVSQMPVPLLGGGGEVQKKAAAVCGGLHDCVLTGSFSWCGKLLLAVVH